jgi:hypothetical protein
MIPMAFDASLKMYWISVFFEDYVIERAELYMEYEIKRVMG